MNVCLIGIHCGSNQGNTAKHTNQSEIIVGTQETSLVLQVLELSQFLFVVEVGQIALESLILEFVEEEVGIADTTPALSPCRGIIVVGGTPAAIVELLNGITGMAIYCLVSGRGQHGTAEIAEVRVKIVVDGCYETRSTIKSSLYVILIVDAVLLVVHLITARSECNSYGSEA